MGNTVLTSLQLRPTDDRFRTVHIGELADQSVVSGFFSNLRDALFPRRLPPLELTSQPIAVADPMAVKRSPASSALSFVLHAGLIALIVWFTLQARHHVVVPPKVTVSHVDIPPYIPITKPAPAAMGGGGGGGAHEVVEASKGHLPPVAMKQVTPPQVLVVDHPKLAAQPTIVMPPNVKLPDDPSLPAIGMPQSHQVALASQGSGVRSGFGVGGGGGIGSGNGGGVGAGSGGGYGGGVMSVGGGVTAPQVLHSVDPEFTDEARRAKYQGSVSIELIVDSQGNPQSIRVTRPAGMGLDERAVAAVRQYKFRPAMYQGHPVPVRIIINVDFHLY